MYLKLGFKTFLHKIVQWQHVYACPLKWMFVKVKCRQVMSLGHNNHHFLNLKKKVRRHEHTAQIYPWNYIIPPSSSAPGHIAATCQKCCWSSRMAGIGSGISCLSCVYAEPFSIYVRWRPISWIFHQTALFQWKEHPTHFACKIRVYNFIVVQNYLQWHSIKYLYHFFKLLVNCNKVVSESPWFCR